MFSRLGLRWRMTLSYVAVSVLAVLVVEGLAIFVILPAAYGEQPLIPRLQVAVVTVFGLAGALLAVSVPLAVLTGVLITRGVVARLNRLASAGGRLGEGALEQRVFEGPPDEVGSLERRFNSMAQKLEAARAAERRVVEDEARASERSRIARELHDAVSQDLFSLGMLAGGLEKALDEGELRYRARAMRETAEGAMQAMSELLFELRPSALDEGGLVLALDRLCGAYRTRLGISIEAELHAVDVAPDAELAMLRLAQEGLSNAVRHAHARSISLALRGQGDKAVLTIKDDGVGFVQSEPDGHGVGLRQMRDRVAELGGGLEVDTRPGMGTVVRAWLPLAS